MAPPVTQRSPRFAEAVFDAELQGPAYLHLRPQVHPKTTQHAVGVALLSARALLPALAPGFVPMPPLLPHLDGGVSLRATGAQIEQMGLC